MSYEEIRNFTTRIKPKISATEFHNLFLESLDGALIDLLGPAVSEAIYGYVDRQLGLSRDDIPKHIDEIWILFDRVMGKASKIIQKRVLERVYKGLQRKSAETVASGDNLSSYH
ncbi:MAG: hypothetical protein WB661_12710 [Candidatus Bathyarchaeia archaeon]